jgi:hypothetical protein
MSGDDGKLGKWRVQEVVERRRGKIRGKGTQWKEEEKEREHGQFGSPMLHCEL